jgi:hypothetical protein
MPICAGCREDLPAESFAKDKRRASGLRYKCRACSSQEFKQYQQTPNYRERLQRQVVDRRKRKVVDPKRHWASVAVNNSRARAKTKGLDHTLTVEQLLPLCVGVCPALGCELTYGNDRSLWYAAALDRIDNDRGYTADNVWVISMRANRIKTDATVEEIEAVAGALRLLIDKGLVTVLRKPPRDIREVPPPSPVVNPYAV